ncbi:MAG: sulfatase [Promethearchaeota archaeon]
MKPNILFILIDDLGWKDLSCMGSEFYETPNIDSIADNGVKFTHTYASCPVCSPTRASIMTGKYPARVGITQWIGGHYRGKLIGADYLPYLPLEEKTIAKTLKENGYKTYHIGKWHLGDEKYYPENHGFDVNIGGCHWGHPWNGYFSPYNNPRLQNGPKGEYLTDRLTDEAIKLLKSNGDSPFFMYMAYYSVHKPIQVPEEEVQRFKEKQKRLGLAKIDPFIKDDCGMYLENTKTDFIYRRQIQNDPKYAGMIYRLDKNIGRLLNTLKELEMYENTIIIFYSDNGGLSDGRDPPTSNLPLRNGKSYIYEGGLRVPLLIQWLDKVPKNIESDYIVTTPDFYPTILDCCNIRKIPSQHVDGISFYDVLINPRSSKSKKRDAIFWHYPHYNSNGAYPASCIIEDRYKLIQWLEDGKIELYDLIEDENESINIAKNKPDIAKSLLNKLEKWKRDVGAREMKRNPAFPSYLADDYVSSSGKLIIDEKDNNTLKLLMQIHPKNPNVYEIPLIDILEEYIDKTIVLKYISPNSQLNNTSNINSKSENEAYQNINSEKNVESVATIISKIGRLFIDENNILKFYDTHEEKIYSINALLSDFENKPIKIITWSKISTKIIEKLKTKINKNEISMLNMPKLPHVEIYFEPTCH